MLRACDIVGISKIIYALEYYAALNRGVTFI